MESQSWINPPYHVSANAKIIKLPRKTSHTHVSHEQTFPHESVHDWSPSVARFDQQCNDVRNFESESYRNEILCSCAVAELITLKFSQRVNFCGPPSWEVFGWKDSLEWICLTWRVTSFLGALLICLHVHDVVKQKEGNFHRQVAAYTFFQHAFILIWWVYDNLVRWNMT